MTVPVVSGGYEGANHCEKGVYLDVKAEKSHNSLLQDKDHDSIVFRLYDDVLIHQGNNTKNVDTANTASCVGVTSTEENITKENYKDVKYYIGGINVVIVK